MGREGFLYAAQVHSPFSRMDQMQPNKPNPQPKKIKKNKIMNPKIINKESRVTKEYTLTKS